MRFHNRLKTRELVRLLPSRKIVKKENFRAKRGGNGKVARYKEWLVAKGFIEVQGIDFQGVRVPVACCSAIRPVILVSVKTKHVR